MKQIKGRIHISYGCDNFCTIKSFNNKRVDIIDFIKDFDGYLVRIKVTKLKKQKPERHRIISRKSIEKFFGR